MSTQAQSANGSVLVSVPFEADELQRVKEAATIAGSTLSEFAHDAALQRAEQEAPSVRTRSNEEVLAIIREAQRLMREANPERRDLVAELIAERRAEAARE